MKIKVFTKNKDGKIEFAEDELKKLLDEVYWEGYNDHPHTWTWQTPSWSPYVWTSGVRDITVSSSGVKDITVSSSGFTSIEGTVTLPSGSIVNTERGE